MPPKEIYLEFENDPELEWEFYIAERLGIGTVAELRRRMGHDEFVRWQVYYGRKAQRQELAARRKRGR